MDTKAYVSESETQGKKVFRVYCPGGTETNAHGKVYDGASPVLAEDALFQHSKCVARIDQGIAFMFSTIHGERHTVTGRFVRERSRLTVRAKSRAFVTVKIEDVKDKDGQVLEHPPFSIKGEDAASDKAWRVYNRAELKAMNAKLMEADAALAAGGYFASWNETAKWSFSRKAGCSCGCSPGFVLDGSLKAQNSYGPNYVDVWVD